MSGTTKIPLSDLINVAKRECAMRERVYPGRIKAGKMAEAVADYETAAMKQIQTILEFFETWEDTIRKAVEARKKELRDAKDHPAVSVVLNEFPGSKIVGVHDGQSGR